MACLSAFVIVGAPQKLGRANAPLGRYTQPMSNATVLDTKTKLLWQRTPPSSKSDWNTATAYCASLQLDGSGWRIPTVSELQTLIDESQANPSIDGTAFPNTPSDYFWTSSSVSTFSGWAWVITFTYGVTTYILGTQSYWVRCVRSSG